MSEYVSGFRVESLLKFGQLLGQRYDILGFSTQLDILPPEQIVLRLQFSRFLLERRLVLLMHRVELTTPFSLHGLDGVVLNEQTEVHK